MPLSPSYIGGSLQRCPGGADDDLRQIVVEVAVAVIDVVRS